MDTHFSIPPNLPAWAALIIAIVSIFRGQIIAVTGRYFGFWTARATDREEFQQELAEVTINARLQQDAAAQLQKSWMDEQLAEIIRHNQEKQWSVIERLISIIEED